MGGRPRAVPTPWARGSAGLVEINVPDLPARRGLGSATVRRIEQHEGVFFEPSGEQRAAILDQALDPTTNASITANDADGADANAAECSRRRGRLCAGGGRYYRLVCGDDIVGHALISR